MEEIWKDIPDYEGIYQISNLGNVKSIGRIRGKNIILIKPYIDKRGYFFVSLRKDNSKKNISIHQLVAITFLNHKPCGYKLVVDHINNIKTDNRVENLQILTNRQNPTKVCKNTCGYTGVSYANKYKNSFRAVIRINGKNKYLGVFKTAELAYERYKEVRAKIEFSNLHK